MKIMRRILNTALESQVVSLGNENISLEEEQIMLDEAAGDAAEVQQDIAEAERIIEVSDALEDLAVVADGIEEATPAEAQLVEIAGDMAVAGTDVSGDEIVPAMEGYVGRRIATEGIRETAQAIWTSIQNFIKRIWEKIEGFFYKVFGTIPALKKRLAALKDKADDIRGEAQEKKLQISAGVKSLTIDGKQVKNGAELLAGLKTLETQASYVYGDYTAAVAARGEKIADKIAAFDETKAEASAKDLLEVLEAHKVAKLPGSTALSDKKRFAGFNVYVSPALLGNQSLALKDAHVATKNAGTTIGSLEFQRRSGLELIATSEKAKDLPSSFEFATLTSGEIDNLVATCDKLLETLEEYQRGSRSKAIKKAKDDIKKASDKATSAFQKLKDGSDKPAAGVLPHYKAMLNFNQAFVHWAQSPAMPMLSSALTTIKAVMSVAEKSLAQYK